MKTVHEEDPPTPKAPWTSAEEDAPSREDINPLTKSIFISPGRPTCSPSHPTAACTVSLVKVAPSSGPPTMAPPAHHPYRMPMVQNSSTRAVTNSDMPPPNFNGQQGSYDELVENCTTVWGGG